MTSFAIVGGGFAGVGAAVMLRREGYQDLTRVRARRADRRRLELQHLSRRSLRRAVAPLRVLVCPEPEVVAPLCAPGRDPAYVEDVARSHGVLDRIRTGTEVLQARWESDRAKWLLETSAGLHETDVLLTACGQLSVPSVPPLPGLDSFSGPSFHTARWPEGVDVAGKRVAVIGTGCSAIQVGPAIQPEVQQLDIYQRSPGWTFPRMDFPYSERAKRLFERFPVLQRLDRMSILAFHELGAAAMTRQTWLRRTFRSIGRRQINNAIEDPELRRKVTPSDEIGCKRVMATDDWYPTLTKPNVELITTPIAEVTPQGVRTRDGTERPADVLVLATGFQTHGFVAPMEVVGAGGRTLTQAWADVPRAYLGLSVPGFPNMFLLYGPNTNGGTGSVIFTIECGMHHVIEAVAQLRRAGAATIEVRRQAAEAFDRELRAALGKTVWHTGCTNWYVDENGNDPNQWPWLWSTYRRRTAQIAAGTYELAARAV